MLTEVNLFFSLYSMCILLLKIDLYGNSDLKNQMIIPILFSIV